MTDAFKTKKEQAVENVPLDLGRASTSDVFKNAPISDTLGQRAAVNGETDLSRQSITLNANPNSAARYLHLVNSGLFGVGVGDFAGNVIEANDTLLHILGCSRAELNAGEVRWTELTAPESHQIDEISLAEVKARRFCRPYEKTILRRDGSRVSILIHIATTPDDPEYMVVSIIDLTKQKHAEKELRTSEARLRLLVEGSQDYAFFMLDSDGHVVTWNAGAERNKGYRANEIVGKHFSVFYPPEDVASGKPQQELERAMEGRVEDEGWRVRKDGSRFWANVIITALRDDDGKLQGFAKITKDITERRRSEALLTSTLNNVIDGIIGTDEHGKITLFNAAAERMFGRTESEVLGKNVNLLMPEPHRSGHDAYMANYRQTGQAKIIGVARPVVACRKDGTTFPVELAVSEFFLCDQRHFTGVVRDITQKRELEDQLRHAQKMEAVGRLAGGIAHDFNNMLTVIFGYSEHLLDTLSPTDPLRPAVEAISEAGQRAAGLTRQLLAFSRRAVLEPKLLDLNAVVGEAKTMLLPLLGEDILLTTVFDPNVSRFMADPGQIDQVLMNLAVNARDAMPEGGQLTIETSNCELGEQYSHLHPEVEPGKFVKLTMTDTGCGMTPEVKARIFEPFFTTKGPGEGTGLGLATVYGIVKQSGGHIEVYSELKCGTSFTIYLPTAEQAAPVQGTVADSMSVKSGTETILVVEDENAARNIVVHTLAKQGYKLLQAADAGDALVVAQNHNSNIDLLVTDVVMPEMNGRQLAEILDLRFPGIKVLFMSGYTDDAVIRHGILRAEVAFIQKPFTPVSLASKVREILDQELTSRPVGEVADSVTQIA